MPKLKTNKSIKGRFKISSSGKVIVHRSGKRHLLGPKRAKKIRQLRKPTVLGKAEWENIKLMLPYEK